MTKGDDQLQKLLEKTNSASAGMKAFFMQLDNQGGKSGSGTFTFDLLTKGLQGFEDETVKALTGGKTNWMSYFSSLDQMALKFMLNKEMGQLFKVLSGSSLGKSLGLDKLLTGGQGGAAAQQLSAGTLMQSAAAMQLAAAQIMASSGATSGGGGGGGATIGDLTDSGASAAPGDAAGTNFSPGGLTMVGEDGPELVNLPSGSVVTPNGSARGNSVAIHIDARGGEIGVEEKIARAISDRAPQIIMRAVVEAGEVQRRSLH
jgi:hypothetical protein